jgi:hypothetical protein
MKFTKYIYTAAMLIASVCCLYSCSNDDETNRLSDAVLASASSLTFSAADDAERIVTVYSDANWVSEVPDWITISPTSGCAGVTEVSVRASSNMREGTPDRPRKDKLVFKGRTFISRAEVLVVQAGEKYRDVANFTVAEILQLANEEVLMMSNATVMAVTTKGFILADEKNTGNIFVEKAKAGVNVGDVVTLKGERSTDAQAMATIACEELVVETSGVATYPQAQDITESIDSYKSDLREYISVTGKYNGTNIIVSKDAKYQMNIVDPDATLPLASLNGHNVTVYGYFAGVADPVKRIMVASVKDNGALEKVYFSEDFEWLDEWSVAGECGRTVETDNPSAASPQLAKTKITVDGVQVTAKKALENKGYVFVSAWDPSKSASECIYLQQNYLKFGKTSYQAGIVLPEIDGVPSNGNVFFTFDWCPMRQGSGIIDPVNLIVVIENGSSSQQFSIPESGFVTDQKLSWIKAEVDLTGVTITKETRITIKQLEWGISTANRWFLDNIKLYQPEE